MSTPGASGDRPGPGERRLIQIALLVTVAHVLDESLWHRAPGVPLGRHAVSAAVVTAAAAALPVSLGRLAPFPRAVVAGLVGSFAVANGAVHLVHVHLTGDLAGADLSGALAALAGVLLLGVAGRGLAPGLLHRHRGRTRANRGLRHWGRRAGIGVLAVVTALLVVFPAVIGVVQTHGLRAPVGAPPAPAYHPVTFAAADGLTLAGWYRPSVNGAAVVVVSSGRGDREGAERHARLLGDHGFGVLLYDARGSGRSDGDTNGYGWGWEPDVEGAVTFLRSRADVHAGRIGALGLSTGADVVLQAGAEDHRLRAIVADGATGRMPADAVPEPLRDPAGWVYAQVLFGSVRLWSGQRPGAPLVDLVPRISPTPLLLVAAGSLPVEMSANLRYADAAREPVTLWQLPHVDHVSGISQVAADYERTVIGFLERYLLR